MRKLIALALLAAACKHRQPADAAPASFDEADRSVLSDDAAYFKLVGMAAEARKPRGVEVLIEATLSQEESTAMLATLALVALSGRAAGAPKADDLKARYKFFRTWLEWWEASRATFTFPDDLRAVKLPLAGTYGEMADALAKAAEKGIPRHGPRLRLDDGDVGAGKLTADARDEEDVIFVLRVLRQKTE